MSSRHITNQANVRWSQCSNHELQLLAMLLGRPYCPLLVAPRHCCWSLTKQQLDHQFESFISFEVFMQFNANTKKKLSVTHWFMMITSWWFNLTNISFAFIFDEVWLTEWGWLKQSWLHMTFVWSLTQHDRAAESYESPVNEEVWKDRCAWGIAARKDPHTLPRLKSLPASLWFPHAKSQV